MSDSHELSIERIMDAPVDAVWRAWTEHLEEWWAPKPWTTKVVEQDLRAGGRSVLDMRGVGPDGEEQGGPMDGVFLEVTPQRRIVFTNVLASENGEWQPRSPQPASIIGFFEFADAGDGRTRYRAGARHWTREAMEGHRDMGFAQGWGMAADQLEQVAKRVAHTADA